MPPLQPVSNVLRADLLWSDATDISVSSRLFFRYSGSAPDATAATQLAADIYGAAAAMNALWDEASDLTGVRVTDLASSAGGQGEHAQSTAGGNIGAILAGSTATVVSYVIQRRYRGGKPRNYFPWGTTANLTTRQQWTAQWVTDVDSALSTFFAAVIGLVRGGCTITEHVNVSYFNTSKVVISPTTGRARNVPQPRATPLVDDIVSFAASSRPGSQRRRN